MSATTANIGNGRPIAVGSAASGARLKAAPQIDRSLVVLARIIGRKHGVEIVFSSDARTAYTNGKRITLPLLANLGSDEHAKIITALIDHECVHVRYADWDALKVFNLQATTLDSRLLNIFEDVWGEREQAGCFPGCAINIREGIQIMCLKGLIDNTAKANEHPAQTVVRFILLGLFARWYELDELAQAAAFHRVLLERLIDPVLVDRIWETALEIDHVRSTGAAIELTRKIVALIALDTDKESDSRQPSNDDQPSNDEQESDDIPSAQSGTNVTKESGSNASGTSTEEAARKKILAATDIDIEAVDVADRLIAALDIEGKIIATDQDDLHANLFPDKPKPTTFPMKEPEMMEDVRTGDIETKAISRRIAIGLGSRLESLLESRLEGSTSYRRSGKRLQGSRIVGLRFGKLDVFQHTEEGVGIDTAVAILFDCSDSMMDDMPLTSDPVVDASVANKTKCLWAGAGMVHAASVTLAKHDIAFATFCFGKAMCVTKPFDKPWKRVKDHRLAMMMGSTLTDMAILRVIDSMEPRPESRKIMVVVTDGLPDSVVDCVAALHEARRHGIECAVLFIGNGGRALKSRLEEGGFHIAVVNNAAEMTSKFFAAIEHAF